MTIRNRLTFWSVLTYKYADDWYDSVFLRLIFNKYTYFFLFMQWSNYWGVLFYDISLLLKVSLEIELQ